MSGAFAFLRPEWLPALLVAPAAWAALRASDRARAARLADVLGPRADVLAAEPTPARRALRRTLACTGLLLALVAAAGPSWGESASAMESRGADVVVCLDVSRSMLARDEAPDRLSAAKAAVREFAEATRGDRLALVVFSGEARLAVPLTRDAESFARLADEADPTDVAASGTDLGAALDAALEALRGGRGDAAAVVLVTDGDDADGRGLRAAARLRERGVPVHCVGHGTALGARVPVPGPAGETFLRDRAGNEVLTALDATSLRRVAEATGGTFVESAATPSALVRVYEDRIVPQVRRARASDDLRDRPDAFRWPLLAAFALWILDLCLGDRSRR